MRDGAIDFQDGAGLGWGQRRRAGRAAPGGSQGGQVGGGCLVLERGPRIGVDRQQ
ncbi:MAG: hypothetical protein ACJ72I_24875 [Pseudonocardiaceae bacterium]